MMKVYYVVIREDFNADEFILTKQEYKEACDSKLGLDACVLKVTETSIKVIQQSHNFLFNAIANAVATHVQQYQF